jgi:hypothetical protein
VVNDPATKGCFRELVREKWGPMVEGIRIDGCRTIEVELYLHEDHPRYGDARWSADTEAAALLAAFRGKP